MTLTLKMGSSVHLPQHGHVLFIIGNSFGPTMGYMGAQSSKMWQNLVFNKDMSYFGNVFFYILWKKSRLKSTFRPYHVKKHHSTLEMDTFKIMLLLSYLASLDNKPRT